MERTAERLSSLKDLKLQSQKTMQQADDGQRTTKKMYQIKGTGDDKKIYENFTVKNKIKTKLDKNVILKSLSSHFIFSELIRDKSVQDMLLEKFSLCKVVKGDYLMKQNDNASSFFILHDGLLTVEINGDQKRKILPGEGFGELALLYSAPRSASIKAIEASFLWFIDRTTFKNAVESIIEKSFKQNRKIIESSKFFSGLTTDQKDKITAIGISQKYEKNSKLVKEGDLASSMFILKSGKLRREANGKEVGIVIPGDSFEEYAPLSKNSVRRETISALDGSEVIAFGTEDIQRCLGHTISFIVLRNRARNQLLKSGFFKSLQSEHVERVIDCFQLRKVKKGEKAIEKGKPCHERILFVIQGQYETLGNKLTCSLFGIKSLANQSKDVIYDFDLIFKTDGKVAEFSRASFQERVGMTYEELLNRGQQLQNIIQKQQGKRHDLKNEASKMKLQDFISLKKLGEGQFGVVHLVTDSKKKRFFALKCISKSQTLKAKLQKHLLNEKQVLQNMSNPFVMEYMRSYKDSQHIYFLTEFINGVELFDAIRVIGLLNLRQSQFYGAIVLHAIQAMHKKSIIYRDMKPENVMVGEDGYLKIIDMGACKRISKTSASHKTFTIIGTPNYMAPEVLAGKGYTYSVDLWSLGVMLFEFMAGYVPFGEDVTDPYEIYEEILKNTIKFPNHMHQKNTNSFIMHLLDNKAEVRLCGSYSNLKDHPFFQGLDWNALLDKTMEPPFKLPKENFINIHKLLEGAKPLGKVLTGGKLVVRKGLDPNWDASF